MKLKLALTFTTIAAIGAVVLLGQQGFTADQATAGRASYQASCQGCHQPDLGGLASHLLTGSAGLASVLVCISMERTPWVGGTWWCAARHSRGLGIV